MDTRLKMKSSMTISGPSQCGKSTFTHALLALKDVIFDEPPIKIYYYYGEYNPSLLRKPYIIEEGLPDSFDHVESGSIVVLDDLMEETGSNKKVTGLFTKVVHHKNLFVINMTQNFFQRTQDSKTQRLNSQYIVLFKNPSDATQINIISRQMYPSTPNFLTSVYSEATRRPHGYVFIDLRQETPDQWRVRTNILEHEFPQQFFVNCKYK
jgi:hypothetical protein